MNKDLDERLLSSTGRGQYRDALNIQVATSDGGDVGSAQTLLGNTEIKTVFDGTSLTVPTTATVVSTLADTSNDKIYYFVSAGDRNDTNSIPSKRKDYIIEFDSNTQRFRYVFVDIFSIDTTSNANTTDSAWFRIGQESNSTINITGVRIGMKITGTFTNSSGSTQTILGNSVSNTATYIVYEHDNVFVTDIIKDGTSGWKIYVSKPLYLASGNDVKFTADRVLNFSKKRIITGVNVLDGNIYWTDNYSEPKKINVKRSYLGTGGAEYLVGGGTAGIASAAVASTGGVFQGDNDYFHTRLVKADGDLNYFVVTNEAGNEAIYMEEQHATVIKKAPTQPLDIEMYRDINQDRVASDGTENPIYGLLTGTPFDGKSVADIISLTFDQQVDFRLGDILYFILPEEEENAETFDIQSAQVRVKITVSPVSNPNNLATTGFSAEILSIEPGIDYSTSATYNVRRDSGDPLFEFQFPRFSYRYKYQDGEYSTFAPFSEVAFLPDLYEYFPKKGFNLGMRNQARSIKLKGYFWPTDIMPQDIIEIDILYKETNNPTVYVVKTLKSSDGVIIWPDLRNEPNMTANNDPNRGEYLLTTDMIHTVVPSNQLLRPWDNVPRMALAQDISANRIIYANYVQNYTVSKDPIIKVSLQQDKENDLENERYALPSVKSLRNYQVGVVFSDEYGRETPVLTSKDAMIRVDKNSCNTRNRLNLNLDSSTDIPYWAKYYSFYIKEISSEYYSLAMDRWYNAADGNIWLSFPSSERNKLDEETFLILKKAHGSSSAVTDKARYKILAIENEAPDFVKTKKKILGTVTDAGKQHVGNQTRGYPLQDNHYIIISESALEDSLGDNFVDDYMVMDKMFILLRGQGQVSDEYEVSKVSKITDGYKIKITSKFEDDASFVSTNDTFANRIDDLKIDFIEHEVENAPEFDGRFFVKIYKDAILEDNVLSASSGETEYIVAGEWGLRYLNNNAWTSDSYEDAWHNGSNPTGKKLTEQAVEQHGNGSGHAAHPTAYTGHSMPEWGGGHSGAQNEKVPSIGGIPWKDVDQGSMRYLTDNEPKIENFWVYMQGTEDFFIDCSSAFSWTSQDGGTDTQFNQEGDRPGNEYSIAQGVGDYYSKGNVARGHEFKQLGFGVYDGAEGSPTGKCGNAKFQKGQPSRGIWGPGTSYSYMDISWTGMGDGWDNDWENEQPWSEQLSEAADENGGVWSSAHNFITTLCAPGCRFRFRRDPDEIIYTVESYANEPKGWNNSDLWRQSYTSDYTGAWGIRNSKVTTLILGKDIPNQHAAWNKRQRWTLKITPAIGSQGYGYNPMHGTKNTTGTGATLPLTHDASDQDVIEIMREYVDYAGGSDTYTENPAIWETEPKETVDIDIYYQIGGLIPIELSDQTNEELIPLGGHFFSTNSSGVETKHIITQWSKENEITFTPTLPASTSIADGADIYFYKRNNYKLVAAFDGEGSALTSGITMKLHGVNKKLNNAIWHKTHILDWSNCFCFFNGAESDRARDDFNQKQFDNGVKASSILAEPIQEERRDHGLIWSGIYNSQSGVNNTNQFIQAEKITKDLNPVYGSIQKLHQRNTDLIVLTEDKVLKVLSNKDALFNADGNTNVTATDKVLGAATPYKGKFGISKNPESFAATPYQLYFTDPSRGQVCALSGEGIRSISDIGMKDYFSDLMKEHVDTVVGSYDDKKHEYNITVNKRYDKTQIVATSTTISYNEKTKGWTSFKSFIPQQGISLNNQYYTFHNGTMYKHHDNSTRNNFYGTQYSSNITLIFSDPESSVKSFGVINYEGSKQKISAFTTVSHSSSYTGDASTNNGVATVNYTDDEYFNLTAQNGWYIESIASDLQKSGAIEFKNKEGKYYGYPTGLTNTEDTLDTNWNLEDFSSQGIGTGSISHSDPSYGENGTYTVANNTATDYAPDTERDSNTDGAGDGTWDATADVGNWTIDSADLSGTVQVGTALGSSRYVDLTISNVVNGVWTGYLIEAENFKVGEAAETPTLTWTGGNIDIGLEKVVFSNNGTVGQPDNTVKARVHFKNVTPTTSGALSINRTFYVDIDEDASNPAVLADSKHRDACIKTEYEHDTNHTVTVTDVSNITELVVASGTATVNTLNKHSGNVNDNVSTKIADLAFVRDAGYYYQTLPTISFNNIGNDYSNAYTYQTHSITYSSGLITAFKVSIYYTPPAGIDPPGGICEFGHEAFIRFRLAPVVTQTTNTITRLQLTEKIGMNGGSHSIKVSGIPGTAYAINTYKTSATTSSSPASGSSFFDYKQNKYISANPVGTNTNNNFTIGSKGYTYNSLSIPASNADLRYEVYLSSVSSSTVSGVPNQPNETGGKILQYGQKTMTFGPSTGTVSNFGTLPSAITILKPDTSQFGERNSNYKTVKNYSCQVQGSSEVRGSSKGTSSTRLVLNDNSKNNIIKAGYHVFGANIPYNTTVTKIDDKTVTLSQAATANNATLTFYKNTSNIHLFSFTIAPNSNTLNVTSSKTVESDGLTKIAGAAATVTVNTNAALGASTTLTLDSTNNLAIGMTAAGTGITGTPTISSITDGQSVVLSESENIANDIAMTFTGGTGRGFAVLDESITKVGSNIIITGALLVEDVEETITININVDNLITVS